MPGTMKDQRVAVLGLGKIGTILLQGLLKAGLAPAGVRGTVRHAERAVSMNAQSADALEIRGTIRYQRFLRGFEPDAAEKVLGQARADLEGATKLNPNQVGAWTVLSHLYYQTRDRVAANRAARAAYEQSRP